MLVEGLGSEPYEDVDAKLEAYRRKFMGKHLRALLEELHTRESRTGLCTAEVVFVSPSGIPEPDSADDRAELAAEPLSASPDSARQPVQPMTVAPAGVPLRIHLATPLRSGPQAPPAEVLPHPAPARRARTARRSPVLARYVMAAALVACGILFSLLTFQQTEADVFSRLLDPGVARSAIAGIVRPASESTITVAAPVRIQEVLVEPGQTVTLGQALFVVDDREARLALPAAKLEMEEARLQVQAMERAIGSVDREMRRLSEELTATSASLDVATRQVAAVPTPQVRESVERAQAALDLALLRQQRLSKLFADGVVARRELDEADVALRVARDDLEVAERAEAAYRQAAAMEVTRAEARTRLAALQEQKQRLQASAELARARIRHERALTEVQALEERVADSRVEAPSAGTIAEVRVSRGDVVAPGAILARMADVARLVVEVQVPAEEIPRVRRGGPAEVTISAAREIRERGTIRSIEPTAGPNGTHRLVVGFEAPPGIILSGQAATVVFP